MAVLKDTIWSGDFDELAAAINHLAPIVIEDGAATIFMQQGLSVTVNPGNRVRLHDDNRIEVLAG